MSDLNKELEDLREKIDSNDKEIVKRLNERVKLALKISEVKKEMGLPVYDAKREERVLNAITESNGGAIPDEVIKRIFSLIIKETRELEEVKRDEQKI